MNSELALRPGFQPLARKATEARGAPRFAELEATVVQTRGASPLDRSSGFIPSSFRAILHRGPGGAEHHDDPDEQQASPTSSTTAR
jgi:hypothetical protein